MAVVQSSEALGRPEAEFEAHVLRNIDAAERIMGGYRFRKLRSMIEELGAVETAKRLLHPSNVSHPYDGFSVLASWELLHLSLQQAVVDWSGSGLFHASLVSAAEVRLAIATKPKRLH